MYHRLRIQICINAESVENYGEGPKLGDEQSAEIIVHCTSMADRITAKDARQAADRAAAAIARQFLATA